MDGPISGGLHPWLVSVIVMLLVMAAAGCSGPTAQQPDSAFAASQQQLPDLGQSQLPALPDPAALTRSSSAIATSLSCAGSGFRADLPSQDVSTEGQTAVFTPGATGMTEAGAAFALYEFDLTELEDLSQPFGIRLWDDPPEPADNIRVFAGLGDPDHRMWQWVELTDDPPEPAKSFSWGLTPSDPSGGGEFTGGVTRTNPYLPVAIVVFGDANFRVNSIQIMPSVAPSAGGTIAFRKDWDGTVKGNIRDRVVDLQQDASGDLHATYYDDSNHQLYQVAQSGRSWITQAVDCDGDVGSSHNLLPTADGGLLMTYYDATTMTGALRQMTPEGMSSMTWSPRSNFENGIDESGLPIDAGRNCSAVVDQFGIPHVFYEDATTGRIRHAYKPVGVGDWLHEYISPVGVVAGSPVAALCPDGACVVYMGDGSVYVAQPGTDNDWFIDDLAEDVFNPLDPAAPVGFCDASNEGTVLIIVVCVTGGQRIMRFDLPSRQMLPGQNRIYDDRPGGGCFINLVAMGDGSVRIADYNAIDKTIYFETGDIPGQEQFSSVPAVQFSADQSCEGLAFWADPSSDISGPRDAFLVELSSGPATIDRDTMRPKKTLTGHVTQLEQ